MMVTIDTNIILRLLIGDASPEILNEIQATFKDFQSIHLQTTILAEAIYVLEKQYELEKKIIIPKLYSLCSNSKLYDQNLNLLALNLYKENNLDFSDCVCLANSIINKTKLFTLDKKLDKLAKTLL